MMMCMQEDKMNEVLRKQKSIRVKKRKKSSNVYYERFEEKELHNKCLSSRVEKEGMM